MKTDELKNDFKNAIKSKNFKRVIYAFIYIISALVIFGAGISVGFHKASFGRDWKDNYSHNFGSMHRGSRMMGNMFTPENFPNAHGSIGKIIKIELPTLIVSDNDGTEKVILIKDDTQIRLGKESIDKSKLKLDDMIVVIGKPNNEGQIEAKLIRVLPAPLVGLKNYPTSTAN